MYKIVRKDCLAPQLMLMDILAPQVAAKALPGQFVMLRINDGGERIPLTIADFDRAAGTITCVFQEVGKTTRLLGSLTKGDAIADFAGPLGTPTHIDSYGTVVCIGGGVGIAPIHPVARALKQAGNEVVGIIGARTRELLFWEDKMNAACSRLLLTTDDGSYVRKGFVTELLKEVIDASPAIALCVAIGPLPMMEAVAKLTREHGVKCMVSLNTTMVDGTGMCGGCRVTVGGKTRFTCVDGPEFDGHQVDFTELRRRSLIYKDAEKLSEELYRKKSAHCKCQSGGCADEQV